MKARVRILAVWMERLHLTDIVEEEVAKFKKSLDVRI